MIQGLEISDTQQQENVSPDEILQPEAELWLKEETDAGLAMPVGFYAIMESAYRNNKGLSIEENRDQLADLYHQFSLVAAQNPHAWKQEAVAASTIRNASDKNPMLAFPYTKLHNTSWNVDQASAMIFTSYANALALGLDESRFIYLQTSVENNKTLAVTERKDLHRSIGAEIAAKALLERSQLTAADIDFVDLYSCFPIAVEIYRDALGLSDDKALTYTGGMPFAGGPLNNYALQAACRLFELLRENPGKYGLTSSVSGLLNKQAFGLWSTQATENGFQFIDVSEQVVKSEQALSVVSDYQGEATIDGYTVLFVKGDAERVVAICSNDNQQRMVLVNTEAASIEKALSEELCGRKVAVSNSQFNLL
jgi:acetyl-CoA C-acetyltransferase